VPDRSTIGGVYGGWLVHENCTTGSPQERVYRKPDGDPARHRATGSSTSATHTDVMAELAVRS